MKSTLVIPLALLFPLEGYAGLIYGTVRNNTGAPIGGMPVSVACPEFGHTPPQSVPTDGAGAYRIFVDIRGRCQLQVGSSAPTTVFSYDDPIRYDFDLIGGTLRRR